jgi:hypothetical protein
VRPAASEPNITIAALKGCGGLSAKSDRTSAGNSAFRAAVIRDLGPVLQLFRIESERLKLSAPFSRRIAEPLDADAAGQATFYCCFDKIGCEEGE